MTGFEPLIAAATAGVTGIVTDIIKKEGTNVITRLLNQDISKGAQKKIFNASQKYVETYMNRHGLLKVLGMREPVNLDDVYTAVVLLDSAGRQSFSSIEDLKKAYRDNLRKPLSFKSENKRAGIKVANETQFLMVLGAPGAGKSTFLRKVGLEALKASKGKYKHRKLPVFLELKCFTEDQINIKNLIIDEFEVCGFTNPKKLTEKALKQGELLILLDGLDEVPNSKRDSVIDIIQNFVDQYDRNRFIASCRVAAYKGNFRRYTDVCMSEFGDGQIKKYIDNWFCSEEDQKSGTAKRFWDLLQKPENITAKELAHTPLLLTFLCLVYDRSQNILNNRSALYKKALRILLEEWAAEKRISRDEIYQGLNVELEELLLAEIAYERFTTDRLFMRQDNLVSKIKSFLTSNLNAPQHLSGEKVLNEIVVQQGILVEQTEDIYSFSHLTLQEYLTAKYIIEHDEIDSLVQKNLSDRRWREVFLLIAGAMPVGADLLLISMSKFVQQMVQSTKIQAIFRWVNRIVAQQNNVDNSLLLRLDMIGLVLAQDRGCVYNFDHVHARERGSDLATNLVRDLNSNHSTNRVTNFAIKLAHVYILAHDIARDLSRDRERINDPKLNFSNDLEFNYTNNFEFALLRTRELANELTIASELANELAFKLNNREESTFPGVNFSKLAQNLELLRKQQPRIVMPVKQHQEFAAQLLKLKYEIFQIDESMFDFEQQDEELLESYLYVLTLIVQCKKEAISVSRDTWESVANNLLVPS